jgi:hypothetical protein
MRWPPHGDCSSSESRRPAFVVAEYRPARVALEAADFEKLEAFIEAPNPPLVAIENFRP